MTNIPNLEQTPAQAFPDQQPVEFSGFGSSFPSLSGMNEQRSATDMHHDQGPVPHSIMHDIEHKSDADVRAEVDAFIANAPGKLIPALYASAEVELTREAWGAVTEFVSTEVAAVSQIMTDFIEMGPESLDQADVKVISAASARLASIEVLQDRLGLANTPQGQAVSIASAGVNTMSELLAGAIANPSDVSWYDTESVGGMGLLIDAAPSLESLSESLENPDITFLRDNLKTRTTIEALVNNELNMDGGILDRGDFETLSPEQRRAFDELIDPEVELGESENAGGPVPRGYPPSEPVNDDQSEDVDNGPVVDDGEGSYFDTFDEDADVPVTGDTEGDGAPIEEPETDVFVTGELDEGDELGEGGDVAVVEMDGGGDLLVEAGSDAPAPWYEQSISRNLVPLDGVSEVVSELYNTVVENAEQIVGENGFLDTGVMTGFTAFLEELGEAIGEISPEDAANIPEIVAPLLLDLAQGLDVLEQSGLNGTELYGATQVMTEVIGSVYYAGEIAKNDPERGAALLTSILPQVQLLGEVFGQIVDTYSETGEVNISIQDFFGDARTLAAEIYESIYEINGAIEADVDADA